MNIKKIVITQGRYVDKELRLLVSFDENDNPLDIINLDSTKIGTFCEATVEKVLNDIDACILKLSNGDKGFIENRKLQPDFFKVRHSQKKKVCQGDVFNVSITQDKKGSKPYSCKFEIADVDNGKSFIDYFVFEYAASDYLIISDLQDVIEKDLNVKAYTDDSISLWQLYDFTKLLDRITSKICHLKNGGNIVVEATEAMTVIDVNSSKNSGKGSAFETNKIAAEQLSRQLRLRSISGIIIVDFLKVSKDEENELISLIKDKTKDDISTVSVHGFTHLGLLELTRSRSFTLNI